MVSVLPLVTATLPLGLIVANIVRSLPLGQPGIQRYRSNFFGIEGVTPFICTYVYLYVCLLVLIFDYMNKRESMGVQLRAQRVKKEIGIDKLAAISGLSKSIILNIEKGRTNYTIDSLFTYLEQTGGIISFLNLNKNTMSKIGDTIQVDIPDASKIDPEVFRTPTPMSFSATILEDRGTQWYVELHTNMGGKTYQVNINK